MKVEEYMKKEHDIQQVKLQPLHVSRLQSPGYSIEEYKVAIKQCFRLGRELTHFKRAMKMVFKTAHEKMRLNGLAETRHWPRSTASKRLCSGEDLTASQQFLEDAWEEASWWTSLEKSEEWTVAIV
jgi:hypothetical protein